MPVDPLAIAEGFSLLNQARAAGFAVFKRWRDRDNFKHLQRLLEARFERDPFLSSQNWGFLLTSADVGETLDGFFVDQRALRPRLPEILLRYIDVPSDAAPPREEMAEQITKAIEDVAPKIWDQESDRIVYELRKQMAVVEATHSNTEVLLEHVEAIREGQQVREAHSLDALPEDIRPYLERMSEEDEDSARRLCEILLGAESVADAVVGLIDTPQGWIKEARNAGSVWAALGRLAAHYGRWERAERAFLAADEAGYGRRASVIAKASEAAHAQGETERASELLAQAEALNRRDAAVAIRSALLLDDPDEKLARLAEAEPTSSEEEAAVEANRAATLLSKGDVQAAHEAALRALELAPRSTYAKVVLASAKTRRGLAVANAGQDPDFQDLRSAAALLISARETLQSLGRNSEALALVSDICHTHHVAREQLRAITLLEQVAADQDALAQASPPARNAVAETAIALQRPDLAERLLPSETDSEDGRLNRATLRITSPKSPKDTADGAAMLDELLATSTDSGIRSQAALMRLAAATRSDDVQWSEGAEQVLRDGGHADAADGLRSQYLYRTGKTQEAENILLASDNPRTHGLLISSALEAGDLDRAVQLSEALLRRYPSHARSLEHAELLLDAGRASEAETALAPLRRDEGVPLDLRDRAYFLSLRDAYKARRYEETEKLAAEWLEIVPSEVDAAWVRLESLLWLSRYDEALQLIRTVPLEPDQVEKARMLAHIYLRALPPAQALERIAELSDRFDRSDDRLEGLVVVSYTSAGDDLAHALAQRGQQAVVEFPQRFPDSKANVHAVSLEEMKEVLKQQDQHATLLNAAGNEVLAGRLPVALFASAARQPVSATWVRLRAIPIAFADPALAAEELAAAEGAVGTGAVWDPATLVTVGLLGDAAAGAVKRALPRSVIAHAVLQDVDYAAIDAVEGRPVEEQSLAWNAEMEEPVLLVRDPAEIARERERIRAVMALARELEVSPDLDESHPTAVDAEVPEISDINSMVIATAYATLSVAARTQLALFSDDRVIRLLARELGIPSFGTIALLDALSKRTFISGVVRSEARAALIAAGAIDLKESSE